MAQWLSSGVLAPRPLAALCFAALALALLASCGGEDGARAVLERPLFSAEPSPGAAGAARRRHAAEAASAFDQAGAPGAVGPASAMDAAPHSASLLLEGEALSGALSPVAGTGVTSQAGSGDRRDDGVSLLGLGRAAVEVALPSGTDSSWQQTLRVSLSCAQAGRLELWWRGPGQEFVAARRARMSWPGGPERLTRSLRLDREAPSLNDVARPGPLQALRIQFDAEDIGARAQLTLHSVELRSDFDVPDGTRVALERQGVRRQGPLLGVPGSLSGMVTGGAGRSLVLHAALAASAERAWLTLQDEGQRCAPTRVELTPGADWAELRVDLSALPEHQPTRFTLSSEGAGGVVLVGAPMVIGPSARERPDVLLYLVDTLRADRLGSHGYGAPTDPGLSALIAQGGRMQRTLAASNWTRPSVSTLLTGAGPEVHGNLLPGGRIPDDLTTLAGALAEAGWLSVSFVTNHHAGPWSGLDRGFDVEFGPSAFAPLEPASTLTSAQVAAPLAAFLERHRGTPVFVYVHVLDPHAPYLPPAEDLAAVAGAGAVFPGGDEQQRARFEQRSPRYDGELRHVDRQIAALVRRLDQRGPALLAVTSDHGEAFLEHGTWGHWRGLYDEEISVPWIMRWPGELPAGRLVPGSAGLADVAPTLLGLLELPLPPDWTGADLSAAWRGREARAPERTLVVDSVSAAQDSAGRRQLAAERAGLKLIAEVTPDGGLMPLALHDTTNDPGERHDLLAEGHDAEALLDALRAYLDGAASIRVQQEQALDPALESWLREMGYLR